MHGVYAGFGMFGGRSWACFKVDVHPQNLVERTFAILVLIFGLVLFSPRAHTSSISQVTHWLVLSVGSARLWNEVFCQFNHCLNDSVAEYAGLSCTKGKLCAYAIGNQLMIVWWLWWPILHCFTVCWQWSPAYWSSSPLLCRKTNRNNFGCWDVPWHC